MEKNTHKMVHLKIKVPNRATVVEELENSNHMRTYFSFNVFKLKPESRRIRKLDIQAVANVLIYFEGLIGKGLWKL